MESLLTEAQFHNLFDGKDFVFYLKRRLDDYEYIYVNNSAAKFLKTDVKGKVLSEAVSARASKFIINKYNLAIETNSQIDFEDYAYFKSEVRKYETTVRASKNGEDYYILAITKEIAYDRNIEDKYLFMRSLFDNSDFLTVVISNEGDVYEANPQFLSNFDLTLNDLKNKQFVELPIFSESERDSFQKYLALVSQGENMETRLIKLNTLKNEERQFLAIFSPIMSGEDSVAIFLIMQDITENLQQQAQLRSTSHGLDVYKAAISSAAAISVMDLNRNIVEVNDLFAEQTCYTAAELLGKPSHMLRSRIHPEGFGENLVKTLEDGEIWRGEICNHTKLGENYWVDSTIIPLKDELGEIEQYLTINFNITDKKRILTELQNIERTFRLITENTNDLIVITDEYGIILYASPSYSSSLGYDNEELLGKFYSSLVNPQSVDKWKDYISNIEHQPDGKFELLLQAKDSTLHWTEANVTVVKDPNRKIDSQIIIVSREITHRKEIESNLLFMAYHDSLTQLPNRRYLLKEFPRLLTEAMQNNLSMAVLYIDGDGFKIINDTYGHDVGDEFISNFGKVLSTSIRSHDLIVRVGGDEFIVVLTGLTREPLERELQITQVIERIRSELKLGWTIDQLQFTPTASFGIAFFPDHAGTLDELIDMADRALYKAKSYGSNHLHISD